ncbi:hypothetical protein DFH27DRAFT_580121 [Peziza echinospora]|nr:hypothetical protein DFH27DRAFT_580121 [Peziza echinospora]
MRIHHSCPSPASCPPGASASSCSPPATSPRHGHRILPFAFTDSTFSSSLTMITRVVTPPVPRRKSFASSSTDAHFCVKATSMTTVGKNGSPLTKSSSRMNATSGRFELAIPMSWWGVEKPWKPVAAGRNDEPNMSVQTRTTEEAPRGLHPPTIIDLANHRRARARVRRRPPAGPQRTLHAAVNAAQDILPHGIMVRQRRAQDDDALDSAVRIQLPVMAILDSALEAREERAAAIVISAPVLAPLARHEPLLPAQKVWERDVRQDGAGGVGCDERRDEGAQARDRERLQREAWRRGVVADEVCGGGGRGAGVAARAVARGGARRRGSRRAACRRRQNRGHCGGARRRGCCCCRVGAVLVCVARFVAAWLCARHRHRRGPMSLLLCGE